MKKLAHPHRRSGLRHKAAPSRLGNWRLSAGMPPRSSLRVRIGTEDFDEVAVLAEQMNGLRHFAVLRVTVTINEEEIFPRLPFARTRFNFRHVDLVPAERGNRLVQRPGFVGYADEQAGAVAAGGR